MRYLSSEIERTLREDRKMVFVAGPRQVGKTTLVQSFLPADKISSAYFNWDVESHRKLIIRNPEEFWKHPGPASGKSRVILDEIHKYPRWKRFLKGLFDAHGRDLELLVTGSGRLDIYQRGGDSLFGRYNLFRLHPFTLGEVLSNGRQTILSPIDFIKAAQEHESSHEASEGLEALETLSGFPEPLFSGRRETLEKWGRARRHLVLREDLRDLTRIRDIGLIETLVTFLPERVGSPLSLNSLREDLGVAFGTIRGWMESLSRLYYTFEIRPFPGRLGRTLRKEAKVYLYDPTEIQNEGCRFENVVALHLRKLTDAWNDWGAGDFTLHYLRNKEKQEVDFLVVNKGKPFMMVEAKLGESSVSSSLRYFHKRLKPAFSCQVVRRSSRLKGGRYEDGIVLLPAESFLSLI